MVPSEENPDDSYEPPPSEQEKKIPSSFPISRGEYAGRYGKVGYISLIIAYLLVQREK